MNCLLASASKAPDAMKTFAAAHPEIGAFGAWAGTGPWTGSYADERYNGLNSFVVANSAGTEKTVRWSLLPAAQPVAVSPDELAKRGPNFLEQEIAERIHGGPLRWTMVVTVANPGDPTADPSKAWPDDRRTVEVGTLIVRADRSGDGTVHAAISTLIRPSCRRAFGHRTIRSRPHGRPPTRSRMTVARRRPRTIQEPQRTQSHDQGQPALHSVPAPAPLDHGGAHSGHAVHRRGHGVHRHAEISERLFRSTNRSASRSWCLR